MDNIFKIIGIIALAVIILGLVKERAPEFESVVVIAVILLLCLMIFQYVANTADRINRYFSNGESERYILPVIKVLGITTAMKTVSDMCADSGQKAIGHITEIIGILCALASVLPLVTSLIEDVGKII